jgi:hypothetical protein
MGGKSHHVAFDRVDIVPPKDDPRRVITCTADHFHIGHSRGFLKLENCEFSLGTDDIMNMHDNSAFVRRTGPRTVRAMKAGGTMPTVFNAANERAVAKFLKGEITFTDIYRIIENSMDAHAVIPDPDVLTILAVEKEVYARIDQP